MKRAFAFILSMAGAAKRAFFFTLLFFSTAAFIRSQPSFPDNGQLFADTVVPVVYITIPPDSLAWIYANPYSDREFRATFVFDNGAVRDTVDPVGFRLRGNTSRQSRKKSFKVSFNTFKEGGKYQGVEKMNLNGEHNDPSVMRSKIMWDILRKWDIPAPRANHVRVYINGSYYGLYINVEHIDEEFAKSRFGNKDGNLYKCLYPADLAYRGLDPASYKIWNGSRWVYELTTNEEEDDFTDLAKFIGVLHNSNDEALSCDLDRVFNTPDYLKTMAVQIFCGDWDGYMYNKNNFYLYHNTRTGKFEYIPYDVDNTFGIDWFGIDWATRNIYAWQPGGDQQRPLYDRIINNPELRKQFSFYAAQLISAKLDIDSLVQAVEARKEMISPHVASDPFYPQDYGYDHTDFLNSFTTAIGAHVKWGLYPYLQARSESMSDQIEPGIPDPVIKYITHIRKEGSPLHVSAFVEAAGQPATVTLIYSVAGGPFRQVAMTGDGTGFYRAAVDGISDRVGVSYQVIAAGDSGGTTILPCDPVDIAPVAGDTPLLFINEFMADNEKIVADEHGTYSDWIELWNGDSRDIFLGDFYLTDNFSNPVKWRLPSVTLSAGSFILIWADGNTTAGNRHASFRLSKDGEEIGLYSSELLVVDTVTFGLQDEDVSMGRKSDGAEEIIFMATATPGRSNNTTPVGVIPDEERLNAWPNPASGGHIRLNRRGDFVIFNSLGVPVLQVRDTESINVEGLAPGLYILTDGRGSYVRLVIL
jgi:hypothetical protein